MSCRPVTGLGLQLLQHGEQLLEQGIGTILDLVEDVGETVQTVMGTAASRDTAFVVVRVEVDLRLDPRRRSLVAVALLTQRQRGTGPHPASQVVSHDRGDGLRRHRLRHQRQVSPAVDRTQQGVAGLPVGERALVDLDRVGQVLGKQVGVRVRVQERLDLRPPPVDRRRALGSGGLRCQAEPFTPVGGGDEGAGIEMDVAAAQPGQLRERHPGRGQGQQERVAAAEQPARPAGDRQLGGFVQQERGEPVEAGGAGGVEAAADGFAAAGCRVAVAGVDGVDRRDPPPLGRGRRGMLAQEQRERLGGGGQRGLVGGGAPVGEQRPVVPIAGRDPQAGHRFRRIVEAFGRGAHAISPGW
ncbi:hypothetical protein RHRU231_590118 [Rhodococcus ruber]|uniref:Uncharacterized protein n=1 Tax=Rhodococcus ruber TaxID=1830 RepID=A0A098BMV9_9NOCA|nr:hypothetical protein RHRU231_590118 [Rhodococcus ruber]